MSYGLPGRYVQPGNSIVPELLQIFQMAQQKQARQEQAQQRESELTRGREWEMQDRDFEAQQSREQAKAQFEAKQFEAKQKTDAEASKKRDELTGVLQSQWAAQLQRSPDLAPGLQRHADMLAKAGKINPIQLPGFGERPVAPGLHGPPALGSDPQQMAQFQAEAQAGATMRGEKPPDQPLDEIAKRVILGRGIQPTQPEFQPAYQEELERDRRESERRARAGASSVTVDAGGGKSVGLTTAAQTTQQGEVIKADKRLQQIDQIEDAIDAAGGYNAYASYAAEGRGAARRVGSKLGVDVDEQAIERRADVEAAIGGFTNPVISELAGANVPDGEMKRMVQSLPTVDDDGPTLKAKIRAWRKNTEIIRQNGVGYLVDGIKSGKIKLPGDEAAGDASDLDAILAKELP
jgi:hypothetical protein